MQILAVTVFADLEDYGIQAIADPSDGSILAWIISPLVQVVRVQKYLFRFLEPDRPLRIGP